MDPRDVILLAAYGSLVIELTVFPIPSEASTLSLLTQGQQKEGGNVLVDARARSLSAGPALAGSACWLRWGSGTRSAR